MTPTPMMTAAEFAEITQRKPVTIRRWVGRGWITRVGTTATGTALYATAELLRIEAGLHRVDRNGRQPVTLRTGNTHTARSLPRNRTGAVLDELCSATITIPLPSGQQVRIDVTVMPDGEALAHAEFLEAPDRAQLVS